MRFASALHPCSAFGSHVAEKVLSALAAHEANGGLPEKIAEQLEALLALLVDAVRDHLHDYILDRYATHLARQLLCVLAGRDVLPPPGKKQQQWQHVPQEAGGEEEGSMSGITDKVFAGKVALQAAFALPTATHAVPLPVATHAMPCRHNAPSTID